MGVWSDTSPGLPIATDNADISIVTGRINNLVNGLNGTDGLTAIDINGGAIDGSVIGGATPAAGAFTSLVASTIRGDFASLVASTIITTGGSITTSVLVASTIYGVGTWVQEVALISSAVVTGSTVVPYDDTIPQVGEGDEYLTIAITPKNANNILCVEAIINWSQTANSVCTFSLFKDGGAASVYTTSDFPFTTGQSPKATRLKYYYTAGGTIAQTWSVRAGSNGANVMTMNGTAGGRVYGGVMRSWIRVTEYRTSY